jgi:hypothetical protein
VASLGPIKALSRYCQAVLARAELRERDTPELQSLLDELLAVERENLRVTSSYRQAMSDHMETRNWIKRRRLGAPLTSERDREYDAYLERRLGELYADMEVLTLEQLDRTREFEERKAELNQRIGAISGEERALREAAVNRAYARETTYE